MKRFRQGILIGLLLGVLLALAIALTLNDERRRRLRYRLGKLRDAFPRMEHSAQETTTSAREMGSNLSKQVQESSGKLAQHTREILPTVQQNAASLENE